MKDFHSLFVRQRPLQSLEIHDIMWYVSWSFHLEAMMKSGPHPRQKLTSVSAKKLSKPGRHADGNGLYLLVEPSGAKRWILRTMVKGRRTDLGLGSLDLVSLAEAREKATSLRKAAKEGKDPVAERRAQRRRIPTFQEAAEQVHLERSPTYRNAKHAAQWISSLKMYAFPKIGRTPIDAITTSDLSSVLLPIWISKHETASRLKQRIGIICKWAKAHGYITSNPADDLDPTLPSVKRAKNHFKALDYRDVHEFKRKLKSGPGSETTTLGIELTILTCLRTSEVLLGKWSEVNWDEEIWTIPPARQQKLKQPEEHVVPLAPRALEILKRLHVLANGSEYIFPGRDRTGPASSMIFLMAIKRLGVDATMHGFRATGRTWAEEETDYPSNILEKALAHTINDAVQAAYRRGDLLEKRRKFMKDWEDYTLAESYEDWKNKTFKNITPSTPRQQPS